MPSPKKIDVKALNPILSNESPATNTDAIGIFDSGVGGLSIAQCIEQQLPNEHLLYVADTLNAPYGEKSTIFIQQRVNSIAQWFIERKVKAIVVACNTATVSAIDQLRKNISIPVIGVEPAIKPAVTISKSKKVAILVTKATADNQRFLALVAQYSHLSDVTVQPCPGLVELIEQDKKSSVECKLLLRTYLQPLLDKGVDTIVLGCTHYPLVKTLISEICGDSVAIMETAQPVTQQLQRQLASHLLINPNTALATTQFYSSKSGADQEALFSHILQRPVILNRYP
ncbi:glutamate racemase [Colwellia sp. Arc7-635]|uniref:glutamate racemase n=1 Tax=Colwellia sp. Arc7-635 TaxID=2497879 RepID=UPI0019CF50DD|nr:glutamate racemase [Colwellia sp. Arc7-635]